MEISTLRVITTELCGRSVNSAIEAHLPQYAVEVAGVLAAVRVAALSFPADLAPASVFSLKSEPSNK